MFINFCGFVFDISIRFSCGQDHTRDLSVVFSFIVCVACPSSCLFSLFCLFADTKNSRAKLLEQYLPLFSFSFFKFLPILRVNKNYC